MLPAAKMLYLRRRSPHRRKASSENGGGVDCKKESASPEKDEDKGRWMKGALFTKGNPESFLGKKGKSTLWMHPRTGKSDKKSKKVLQPGEASQKKKRLVEASPNLRGPTSR